jgi:transcriptional regulator with XRE-family HTH domain
MTLKEWMRAKEYTDADVAERVEGLSRSQICRIKNRTSIPSVATARKLSVLTGIPVEQFLVADRQPVRSKRAEEARAA